MPDPYSEFLELITISDLANLGPDPRLSRLPRTDLDFKLESWFMTHKIPGASQPALRAAALLWHDHLDDAHILAQEIATTTGSFLHAVVHRREPDYDNARYWFHRVGRHEAFYAIARAATPFLVKQGQNLLASRLLPNGLWNPFAFVDVCAETLRQHSSNRNVLILRDLQRFELESLVAHLLGV